MTTLATSKTALCTFYRAGRVCGLVQEDEAVHVWPDERMRRGAHLWRHDTKKAFLLNGRGAPTLPETKAGRAFLEYLERWTEDEGARWTDDDTHREGTTIRDIENEAAEREAKRWWKDVNLAVRFRHDKFHGQPQFPCPACPRVVIDLDWA